MRIVDLHNRGSVYNADAMDMIDSLDSESIQMLITDPPYSSGGTTAASRTVDPVKKYQSSDAKVQHRTFEGDMRDQRSFTFWSSVWMRKAYRVLEAGGIAAVFTDWRQLPATTDAFQAAGFVWRGTAVWQKVAPRPQAGRFTNACEYLIWGSKGPLQSKGRPVIPGAWTIPSPRERFHVAQKPLELMREILKIASVGSTVLDPFMGSGTTGVAAMESGLRFIGSEIDPVFFDKATARILEAATV